MKKFTLFLTVFVSSFFVKAQITQVGLFSTSSVNTVSLIHLSSGYKYFAACDTFYESSPGVWVFENYYRVFDLNGNIEKTITLPTYNWPIYGAATGGVVNLGLVSDHLFNSDSNIEFVVAYTARAGSCGTMGEQNDSTTLYVMNEIGAIIAVLITNSGCGYGSQTEVKYFSDGTTFSKLLVREEYGSNTTIFNLPGYLPCESCTSSVGLVQANNSAETNGMRINAAPNPSANDFMFQYTLPKDKQNGEVIITNLNGVIVKAMPVNSSTRSVHIDMTELSSGVYIYKLKSGNSQSIPQKLILTK